MNCYTLLLKEEAIADIQKAYEYYQDYNDGLGERFLHTLDEYFERIKKDPQHYQIKRKPYREAYIKKFPYLIIYEIEIDTIIVYAIFNTSRNPKRKPKK